MSTANGTPTPTPSPWLTRILRFLAVIDRPEEFTTRPPHDAPLDALLAVRDLLRPELKDAPLVLTPTAARAGAATAGVARSARLGALSELGDFVGDEEDGESAAERFATRVCGSDVYEGTHRVQSGRKQDLEGLVLELLEAVDAEISARLDSGQTHPTLVRTADFAEAAGIVGATEEQQQDAMNGRHPEAAKLIEQGHGLDQVYNSLGWTLAVGRLDRLADGHPLKEGRNPLDCLELDTPQGPAPALVLGPFQRGLFYGSGKPRAFYLRSTVESYTVQRRQQQIEKQLRQETDRAARLRILLRERQDERARKEAGQVRAKRNGQPSAPAFPRPQLGAGPWPEEVGGVLSDLLTPKDVFAVAGRKGFLRTKDIMPLVELLHARGLLVMDHEPDCLRWAASRFAGRLNRDRLAEAVAPVLGTLDGLVDERVREAILWAARQCPNGSRNGENP